MVGISIVIPTAGRSKVLPRLFVSIRNQKIDFPYEIILVQNNISEKSSLNCDLVIQHEKLKFPGVNRSRNHGLRKAKYDFVFFVDDDCELDDPFLLKKHFSLHQKDTSLFAVGGLYVLGEKAGLFSRLYQEIQMLWLHQGLISDSGLRETQYLIGGHFSVKKSLCQIQDIYFNEDIVYGGSELSFFAKARHKNLQLELHDFSILHHTNESFFSLNRKIFKQGQGQAISELESVQLSQTPMQVKLGRNQVESFFYHYYSLLFWFGYFYQKKQIWQFALFILRKFRTVKDKALYLKSKAIETTSELIESKKQRGDRL